MPADDLDSTFSLEAQRLLLLAPGPDACALFAKIIPLLKARHTILLDSSSLKIRSLEHMLQPYASQLGQQVSLRAQARRLPFVRHAFDAIVSLEALYAIRPPWTVLAEYHRVLEPDGKLLLLEPSTQGLLSMLRDKISGPGKRVFSREELLVRLRRCDFDPQAQTRAGYHFIKALKIEFPAETAPTWVTARELKARQERNKADRTKT